jgi:hypothetical protein
MKCFIASAFDHTDVDAIFNKAITPVLNGLKIKKLRVDRVEHNDDIDDKIFSLIKDCDLCIADLTYARPSVYYEAGFASGLGKPVIYISRRDHFRAREADPAGNLRVHFDLQMKNIIPWTIPNENFKSRLLKRVKHVCKGIAPKRKPQIEQNPDQVRFHSLSIDDQLRAVLAKGKGLIFSKGFRLQSKDTEEVNIRRLGREPANQISFEKFQDHGYENIRLIARHSFTKTEFHSTAFGYKYFSKEESSNLKVEKFIYLYAVLQPVRQTSIRTILSSYTPLGNGIYKKSSPSSFLSYEKRNSLKTVVIIDGFESVAEFSQKLKQKLSLLLG